jgi:hypothetical protein
MIMTIEEMDMKIYAEARKYVYLPKVQRRRRKTNCPNWSSLGFWRCMNQWRKKRYKVMINEEARKKNEKWKIVELTRKNSGFSLDGLPPYINGTTTYPRSHDDVKYIQCYCLQHERSS